MSVCQLARFYFPEVPGWRPWLPGAGPHPVAAAMALFCPFRALGYITAPVPFAVQRRGRETFVTVSVGKAWQCYNCAKLTLVFVGQQALTQASPGLFLDMSSGVQ